MRRWLIGGAVAATIAAIGLAFVLYTLTRTLHERRDWVQQQVEAVLGRAVRFDDVAVTLRDGPGIRLQGLRVAEDPRFGDGDFLRTADVRVGIRLLPALRGRLQVRRVVLEGLDLALIRSAHGLNVDSLGRPPSGAAAARAGVPAASRSRRGRGAAIPRRGPQPRRASAREPQASGGPARPAAMSLDAAAAVSVAKLEIRDGTVHLVDRTVDPPLDLTIGDVHGDVADLGLASRSTIALEGAALGAGEPNLRITGGLGPAGGQATLADVPVDLTASFDRVRARDLQPALPPGVPWPLDEAVELGGRLRIGGTLETLRVAGRVTAGALAIDVEGSVVPPLPADADLAVIVPPVALAEIGRLVPALRRDGVGGRVDARLRVHGDVAPGLLPTVEGSVGLTEASFGPDGPAGITTTVRLSPDALDVPTTRVEIGDAAMQVALHVQRDGAAGATASVVVGGFGGTIEGQGRLDLRDRAQPRFTAGGSARDVILSRLLAVRSAELAERVDGRADAEFALEAAGASAADVQRSLAGTLRATVTDGVLRGVNIAESVLEGVTGGVRGLGNLVPSRLRSKHPELFGATDTRIDELRLAARLAGPVARVGELTATAREWTMRAHGTVDVAGPVDLQSTLTVGRELTADITDAVKETRWLLDDQGDLTIPFRVVGTPPAIRTVPDPAFVARALQRALLDRGLGSPSNQRRGKDDTQDLIRRGLDALLGH